MANRHSATLYSNSPTMFKLTSQLYSQTIGNREHKESIYLADLYSQTIGNREHKESIYLADLYSQTIGNREHKESIYLADLYGKLTQHHRVQKFSYRVQTDITVILTNYW